MKQLDEPLRHALSLLAQQCNGASTRDNLGFNRNDAQLGRLLAGIPESQWSDDDRQWAYWTLRKYRGQLEQMGIDWEKLPRPQRKVVAEKASLTTLEKW
jgi:hypothetical protein